MKLGFGGGSLAAYGMQAEEKHGDEITELLKQYPELGMDSDAKEDKGVKPTDDEAPLTPLKSDSTLPPMKN